MCAVIKQTEAWFSDYENQFSYWTFHKWGRFNVAVWDGDQPSSRWMCPAVFVSLSSSFVSSCLNLSCKNPWCFSSERRALRQRDWADDHRRNISVGNSQKSSVFWRRFPDKNMLGILLTPHFHFNSFQPVRFLSKNKHKTPTTGTKVLNIESTSL